MKFPKCQVTPLGYFVTATTPLNHVPHVPCHCLHPYTFVSTPVSPRKDHSSVVLGTRRRLVWYTQVPHRGPHGPQSDLSHFTDHSFDVCTRPWLTFPQSMVWVLGLTRGTSSLLRGRPPRTRRDTNLLGVHRHDLWTSTVCGRFHHSAMTPMTRLTFTWFTSGAFSSTSYSPHPSYLPPRRLPSYSVEEVFLSVSDDTYVDYLIFLRIRTRPIFFSRSFVSTKVVEQT